VPATEQLSTHNTAASLDSTTGIEADCSSALYNNLACRLILGPGWKWTDTQREVGPIEWIGPGYVPPWVDQLAAGAVMDDLSRFSTGKPVAHLSIVVHDIASAAPPKRVIYLLGRNRILIRIRNRRYELIILSD
jgi:hypothetical protein